MMDTYLTIGACFSFFFIFIASILGIAEISKDYSNSGLFLSLNAFFYSIILLLVECYSDMINYIIISKYTFRFIFHTWTGITLIGTSTSGQFISVIVILYGIWNLVYYIKYVKNRIRQTPMGDIIGITEECFEPISSPSDDITYEEDYGDPVFE